MNFRSQILWICLLLPGLLFADVSLKHIISEFSVEGLRYVKKEQLPPSEEFHVKVGRTATQAQILKDIHQLYLTGYFQDVRAQTIPHGKGHRLEYVVKENPIIEDIVITGNSAIPSFRLALEIDSKKGQVLNVKQLISDKEKLETYYINKGYTLIDVDDIKLNQDQQLTISLSEGLTGATYFSGLKKIHPFVLKRELDLQEDTPFNTKQLRNDRERLIRLGYFSSVSVPTLEPDPNEDKRIDVYYQLKERKMNIIDFGLEQREDSVVTFLRTNVHHVLMHTDMINVKMQAEPNINDQYRIRSYSLRYHQPWFLNRYPFSFTTSGWTEFNREFHTSDLDRTTLFRTQRSGFDIGFGYPIIRDRLFFTSKLKDETVRTERGTSPSFDTYRIHSVSGGLSYTNVDNIFNPRSGAYWGFNIERGGNLNVVQLNGLNFTRYSLNSAGFIPLTQKGTFGLRSFMGVFQRDESSVDTFDAEGFVLGGANSLRGYKEFDTPFIGNREILFNFEYRHTFTKTFQGVLFYDIGKAFDTGFDLNPSTMEVGKGFGIRFLTPLAPLRFDFAWGQDFLIQFGLGQMF